MSEQKEAQLIKAPTTGVLETITGISRDKLQQCAKTCTVCNHLHTEEINWLYATRQIGMAGVSEVYTIPLTTVYRHFVRTGLYAWLHSRDGLRLALSGIVNRGSRAQPRAADAVAAAKIILQLDGHLRDSQPGASARELVDELRRLDNSAWDAIERDASDAQVVTEGHSEAGDETQAGGDANDPGIFE